MNKGAGASLTSFHHQPGLPEHLQVPRDRGQGDVEIPGEVLDRALALTHQVEQRPPRWIGRYPEHSGAARLLDHSALVLAGLGRAADEAVHDKAADMQLADFDFRLPAEQIAQSPLSHRDASRLLTLSRTTGAIAHQHFSDLPSLLRKGDLLVMNDARVVPARLLGTKTQSGGKAELLVVRPAGELSTEEAFSGQADAAEWICLGQSSKGFKEGTELSFASNLRAVVTASLGGGEYRVRFQADQSMALSQALERAGQIPLPPYVERAPTPEDQARYQTVYARATGSVAAPTAGLHFTPELLAKLERQGVERAMLTLDVGPGTFLPVRTERIEDHKMHSERYHVPVVTAQAINRAKAEARRVVAVGTTVVRTLESATDSSGAIQAGDGATQLFVTPGYQFRQVDVLITNFHLPRSTLLMLVSAFAGTDSVLACYREAVAQQYRFFSYGDAMLIAD